MQISGIIPILLNIILSEQQSQKKAPQQQAAEKAAPRQEQPSILAPEKEASYQGLRTTHSEGGQPLLFPMPLKTSLFPDARFYIFHEDHEEAGNHREGEGTGIVFSLATHSLGSLYFKLTRQSETLNIACHTENQTFADLLSSCSEELTKQVRLTGFKKVILRCSVLDPGLQQLQTGFTSPALLDRKV